MVMKILRDWSTDGQDDGNRWLKIEHGGTPFHVHLQFSDVAWTIFVVEDAAGEPRQGNVSPDLFLEEDIYVPRSKVTEGMELAIKLAEQWLDKTHKET